MGGQHGRGRCLILPAKATKPKWADLHITLHSFACHFLEGVHIRQLLAAFPLLPGYLFIEYPILKQGEAPQQALLGALGETKKLQIYGDTHMSRLLGTHRLHKVPPTV